MIFKIIFYVVIFIFGSVVGSFLNCLIYRLKTKESFLKGRSFCPYCKHTLTWRDLIPIFSFLLLKGKCRYCQKKISPQYPLVELASGVLFVLILIYFPQTYFPQTYFPQTLPIRIILAMAKIIRMGYFLAITSFLIVIFVYDLKHFIIPDKVVFPAIIIALFYNLFRCFYNSSSLCLYTLYAAFGAAGFFLSIVLISRGKWMGLGDVKLAFLMGLFLGFPKILVALFLAFLIGAIIGIGLILTKRKTFGSEVPFGPFLVTGTFIALFWGKEIVRWYLNLLL